MGYNGLTPERTKARNELLLAEVRAGAMMEDVGEKYNLAPRGVWAICQKNGVSTAGQWRSRKGQRRREMSKEDLIKWILSKCEPQENGCLYWTGHKRDGYGRIRIGDKLYGVHRIMCEYYHGREMSPDEVTMHSCDTPCCISEKCLKIATVQQNVDDREMKNRNVVHKGEKNGGSVLKESDVLAIRKAISEDKSWRSGIMRRLAEQYGVSRDLIHKIKHRKLWKHIP